MCFFFFFNVFNYPSFRSKATTSLFTFLFHFQAFNCSHLLFLLNSKTSDQNVCVSQNDGEKEDETLYLDPETPTCPAIVPVLTLSVLAPLCCRCLCWPFCVDVVYAGPSLLTLSMAGPSVLTLSVLAPLCCRCLCWPLCGDVSALPGQLSHL